MRLTRYTHACVRLDDGDRSLVIDPGVWSEPQALSDVDAVLVTHEHSDHVDELRLAGLDVPIYAPPRAGRTSAGYQEIEVGTTVTVGGFEITAVGGEHARVVASQRPCLNTGYVVNDSVYHPGDALHVPGLGVDTWACSGLTDIHQVGRSPGKDVHNGNDAEEEATAPSFVH